MASLIEVTNDVHYTLAGTEKILPKGAFSQQRLVSSTLRRGHRNLYCVVPRHVY